MKNYIASNTLHVQCRTIFSVYVDSSGVYQAFEMENVPLPFFPSSSFRLFNSVNGYKNFNTDDANTMQSPVGCYRASLMLLFLISNAAL